MTRALVLAALTAMGCSGRADVWAATEPDGVGSLGERHGPGFGVEATDASASSAPDRMSRAPASSSAATPGPPGLRRAAVLLTDSIEAPLFADEVARVRAAVAKSLDANTAFPVATLSTEHMAELAAVAASGKLRVGGPKCASAPTEAEVVHAAHPDLVVARWSLNCIGEACNAQLEVRDEPYRSNSLAGGRESVRLEAFPSARDPMSVTDWEAAVAGESPRAPDADGGLGGGGIAMGIGGLRTQSNSVRVDRLDAFHFDVAPKSEELALEAKVASACAPRGSSGAVLLAVGTDGRVKRCEEATGKAGCYCSAFSRHAFTKATAERRVRVFFTHGGGMGPLGVGSGTAGTGIGGLGAGKLAGEHRPGTHDGEGRVHVAQSGTSFDESFETMAGREHALTSCFTVGRTLEYDVRSTLDPRGKVVSARVSKSDRSLTAAEKACVETVAKQFVYRCPDAEGDEVWGRFSVY